jgi:hypothetical protein
MEIEKGVPIPKAHQGRSETARLVERMGPGDSVLVDNEEMARNLVRMGKYRKYGMSMRRMGKDEWRVWRIDGKTALTAPVITPAMPPPKKIAPAATDEAKVTALHGFALACNLKVSIDEAKQWVAKGISEDELREAIAHSRSIAGAISAESVRQALEVA